MAFPKAILWKAAKMVHKYDTKLLGHTHLDWSGCIDKSKYTTSYSFNVGLWVVPWDSKKQLTITHSLPQK
jgi:hypothetical protein